MTSPAAVIPQWDQADRMRKALRDSGISVYAIAGFLGVSRTSVSNWINGRVEPSVMTLRLWAQATGVSYRWLCHGSDGPHPPSDIMHSRNASLTAA
jgi:transcriptional regulator with XRE-family HTH domain